MLRLPKGKTTQNILQTQADAFGSYENIDDRDNGHGRAITRDTKRKQIHSGNVRPFYKTCKGLPNEGTNF